MNNRTSLVTILKLIENKYPANEHQSPVLFIYDDESGAILKDSQVNPYEHGNRLFNFGSVEQLVEHLKS